MTTDLPERLSLASDPPSDARLAALREAFPEVFREKAVDFDALRRSLGDWVDPGLERFGLTWPGKAECMRVIQEPSIGTLVPIPDQSLDWATTQNVIIEGDNLEVLKLLQKAYYGKIKLIYLDPPYNTGSEFIYPDNYREGLAGYLKFSGQIDEQGLKLRANTESDGRFHSKWLSMMYPRLFLARNLLHSEGLIAIQIGDTELANLKKIADEIFGEENFINVISVKAKVAAGASGGGEDRRLKKNVEFILLYAKDIDSAPTFARSFTEEPLMQVVTDMRNAGQSWKYTSIILDKGRRRKLATTLDGDGSPIDIYLHEGIQRSTIAEVMRREGISEGEAYKLYLADIFSDTNAQSSIRTRVIDATGPLLDGQMYSVEYTPRSGRDKGRQVTHYYISNTVRRVIWLSDIAYEDSSGEVIKRERTGTLWDDISYNNLGKEGDMPFPNGKKPVELVRRLIDLLDDPDALIVDFFAGSGTTAHAVLEHNLADGGSRRFILVQLPEPADKTDFDTIADIARERVRRVAKEMQGRPLTLDKRTVDVGFKAYSLARSNFTLWDGSIRDPDAMGEQLTMAIEHVADGATEHAMVSELLLKAGYELTATPAEVDFAGVSGYSVAEGALLVCLAKQLTIEAFEVMVALEPAMIVVLDAGFGGDDELKVNALQTVRARNQQAGSDIALRVV